MPPKKDLPSPKMLLVEARGAIEHDAPINLDEYASVIGELRATKNYSFGKVAEWLGERLGRPINKGAVFRVFKDWERKCELEAFNRDEDMEGPPNDLDEAESEMKEVADCALDAARQCREDRKLPASVVIEGLERALRRAKQEAADEKAAEDADASNNESTTNEPKP